jgi:hypothetical protein
MPRLFSMSIDICQFLSQVFCVNSNINELLKKKVYLLQQTGTKFTFIKHFRFVVFVTVFNKKVVPLCV